MARYFYKGRIMTIDNLDIKKKFYEGLNERQKRHFLALESKGLEYGGISLLSRTFKVSRTTIHQGIQELESTEEVLIKGIRKKGGGRKKIRN